MAESKVVNNIHRSVNEGRVGQYETFDNDYMLNIFKHQRDEGCFKTHINMYSNLLNHHQHLQRMLLTLRDNDKRRAPLEGHVLRAEEKMNEVEERLLVILTERAAKRKQNIN